MLCQVVDYHLGTVSLFLLLVDGIDAVTDVSSYGEHTQQAVVVIIDGHQMHLMEESPFALADLHLSFLSRNLVNVNDLCEMVTVNLL